MKRRKRLVIANWKMGPQTPVEAKRLFSAVKKVAATLQNVQTVICPPFTYIVELSKAYRGHRIFFGAQDLFYREEGAHTGEISAPMLVAAGATCVIVGHSERRELGESNEIVNKKIHAALASGLSVVLCIGESHRDSRGEYLDFLRQELVEGLRDVTAAQLRRVVIVYEPIWAIGKSAEEAMKPDELHEMVIFARKTLSELYERKDANLVPVLYGGSVEASNAPLLFERGEIDGLLVGHASLDPYMFGEILRGTSYAKRLHGTS